MAEPLLAVEDLRVEYLSPAGSVCVVDGVSFEIGRGEVLGLAGESGSGKSTIAQAILRVLQPPAAITRGSVKFEGKQVLDLSEPELERFRWQKVSLVFQSAMNALNPVVSIGEQIMDVVIAHGAASRKTARDRAAELLGLVGMDAKRLDSYPHELSGGMRQRVVIAIALALNPPLMIMDEPTTALDVVVQKGILRQIAELKDKLGFSILFITHDLSLMLEFSTRIAILYGGRVAELAPAAELLSAPKHPYTRGLLGAFPSIRGPRRELTGIAGAPPDPRRPPSGCRFHPRCPDAFDRCAAELPRLIQLQRTQVACHLYSDAPERDAP
jgi:peptide/nickel transport system ATP-binding protein